LLLVIVIPLNSNVIEHDDFPYIVNFVPVPNNAKYTPRRIDVFPAPLPPDSNAKPCSPKSNVEFS
jgi:hypothetical protein